MIRIRAKLIQVSASEQNSAGAAEGREAVEKQDFSDAGAAIQG